jgi:hypothetical protein
MKNHSTTDVKSQWGDLTLTIQKQNNSPRRQLTAGRKKPGPLTCRTRRGVNILHQNQRFIRCHRRRQTGVHLGERRVVACGGRREEEACPEEVIGPAELSMKFPP